MSGRERLTPTERYLAYLTGLGIAIVIIALLLIGFGTVDNSDITNSMLLVGLALTLLGIGAWLYLVKPWKQYDDLQTPHYTGQHEETPSVPPSPAAVITEIDETAPVAPTLAAEEPSAAAPAELLSAAIPETPVVEEAPVLPGRKAPPAKAPAEKVAAAKPEEPVAKKAPPEAKPEPAEEADDLTIIEGIGPKTAAALASGGITSFAQVAAMTPEELIEVARAHGARVTKADTWPTQARKAAGGDVAGLDDMQERIDDGELHEDLTRIEGIGPKVQQILYEAGYRTYKSVAEAKPEALREILAANRLGMMKPDTWPEQADLLNKGDLTALEKLQDNLKAGRR